VKLGAWFDRQPRTYAVSIRSSVGPRAGQRGAPVPTYEYMCKKCGPFTQLRAMAACDLPSTCPECGARSPRVILTAPGCLTMSAEARQQGVKYERIIERYDGHEPPPYVRPPRSSKKAPRPPRRRP